MRPSGRRAIGAFKTRSVRATAAVFARLRPRPGEYSPGVTVVTVNWNSLPFLRLMYQAVRAMTPPDTKLIVVDNASTDGSVEWLRAHDDIRVMRLPVNVGHGAALDLAMPVVDTEYVAILDVDAFPISDRWLETSIDALKNGAIVSGAHMHRNFVHPCFLVTRIVTLHELGLTFRPVGSLAHLDRGAPLFLDVGEALAQRVIVKFGGGRALHFLEITESRDDGVAGAVFGGIVYHNMFSTQGAGREDALRHWNAAFERFHPTIAHQTH